VPFVGQAVVDRDAGVGGEFFDVGLLVAAEFDRVVHPSQDGGGVGDRFLVAELGPGRVQVGHVDQHLPGCRMGYICDR
jgi:hypothetical protein